MPLTQLIYISTATAALEDGPLEAILEASVRHNRPQNVTGMLLYADGCFMQVLEGEPEAVEEAMARIRKDDRHRDILVLQSRAIDERSFSDWAMGFRRLNAQDKAMPNYVPFFAYGHSAAKSADEADLARSLLRQFAETNR